MNKFKWIIILTAVIGFTVCAGAAGETEKKMDGAGTGQLEPKIIKHIIFITVDGLTDQQIQSAYTPNINGLAASGVKTAAIGVLPANTVTFMASFLTGADPSVHGWTEPDQRTKTRLFPEIVGGYGRTCAYVSHPDSLSEGFFNRPGEGGIKYSEVKRNSNEAVVNKAVEVFKQDRPFFLGLKLPGLAANLNNREKEGKAAAEAVNEVDGQIGRLLATLRSAGVYEQSLIVLTGIYSGPGRGVRERLPDRSELMVPVVMIGPGLKSGAVLPPVKIIDLAPTVALLAGLQISPESNGMILWNALQSGTGFLEQNLLLKRVKDLSEENVKSTGVVYHLTEEKRLVKIEREKVNREKAMITQTINDRDNQIKGLKGNIRLLKIVVFVTVLVLGTGYLIEYLYLRKKFLMF